MTIKAKEELEFVKSHLTGFTAEEQPDGETRRLAMLTIEGLDR
jgi:hypothetical protein